MIERAVRLPLQTGASAASTLYVSLFFGLPYLGLVALAGLMLAGSHAGTTFSVVPLAAFFAAVTALVVAFSYKRRASDALLDPSGLRFEGGPQSGVTLTWAEIHADDCKVDVTRGGDAQLFLFTDRAAMLVASASEAEETKSLRALLACVRAGCSTEPPPAKRREVEALACPGCGALVAPVDAPEVACRFCGRRFAMPSDVSARLRAAHAVAVSPDAALAARLLEQPGAKRVNGLLVAASLVLYLGAPVALLAGSQIGAVAIAVAFFAIVAAARTQIADRGALRSLLLGFAAHAPSRPGEPETCRGCRAPLPPPRSGGISTQCVFCSAVNISGVDLRADADVARNAEAELRETLAVRSGRRRLAWVMFGLTTVLLVAVLVVARSYVR